MKQPSGKTKFLGLLAHPVDHVKAPSFMNPEFQKMGLNWFVIPMHVKPDNLEDAISGLQKIKNYPGHFFSQILGSYEQKISGGVMCFWSVLGTVMEKT